MKAKTKEVTETKVSDNGEIKSTDSLKMIESRIETTTAQYNDAVQKAEQYIDLKKRCLGALEILQGLKKELDPDTDGDN